MYLDPGTSVDRYAVEGVIGEGGMATVYLVRHRDLGSVHALKLLHRARGQTTQRLVQEGRLQSTIRHPNLVSVTDMVHVSGSPGLVMEYVEGPTLHQFLQRHRMTLSQADVMARGILRGMTAAHGHGMVHRDLKPANILLAIEDERIVPKITDFGLAKVLGSDSHSSHLTQTGATMGTPGYMAPEQISDASKVDERADVFSLGAILYELVTGERAFVGSDVLSTWTRITQGEFTSPRSLRPDLADRMLQAIEGALKVDREARIPNVAGLLEIWNAGPDSGPNRTLPPDDVALWQGDALFAALGLQDELTDEIRAQQDSSSQGSDTTATFDFDVKPQEEGDHAQPTPAETASGPPSSSDGASRALRDRQRLIWTALVLAAGSGVWATAHLLGPEADRDPPATEADEPVAGSDVSVGPHAGTESPDPCADGETGGAEGCADREANRTDPGDPEPDSAPSSPTGQETSLEELELRTMQVGSVEFQMRKIPPGTFRMGSFEVVDTSVSHTPHQVQLDHGYWMATTEVTQELYHTVTGKTDLGRTGCDRCPVEKVTWLDAVEFCNILSQHMQLEPAYIRLGTQVSWVRGANGFRMPTEAEWEYAARANTSQPTPTHDTVDALGWVGLNSGGIPHEVALKQPNRWGLYDMIGNVWEWTWDFVDDYESGLRVNPAGPASGMSRIQRGGGYDATLKWYDLGARGYDNPISVERRNGFRIVRSAGEDPDEP